MLGFLCTRPKVKPSQTCAFIVSYFRLYFSDKDHYGYCSNFQCYGQGQLLVCKDFLYDIVFEQSAERS